MDEGVFKLLTNPRYFNDMLHWQKRREILLEVCGDITDADVIASDKDLAGLPEILGSRSLDDHRKVIAARRTELNREIEKIPTRIDEVTHGLPELPDAARDAYENELNILDSLKSSKEERRLRITAGGEIAEKQKALAELDAELMEMQNELRAGIMEQAKTARSRKGELDSKIDGVRSTIYSKTRIGVDNQKEIERLEARMAVLRAEWDAIDSITFRSEPADICPTCGQALPAEQVQEAREKALADFNQGKAKRLAEVTAKGKDDRALAGELALQNAGLEKEIVAAEEGLGELQQELFEVQKHIDELNARAEDTVNDPAYVEKAAGKQVLLDAIETLRVGNEKALAAIDAEIDELNAKMAATRSSLAAFDAHAKGKARIEELEAQERELAAEYERLEGELYMTEQFVRAKVALLEDKINSRFEHARFKLFNVLVNGGIEEVCETTYQGVPYSSALNNAAQINVGLDIINTLSEHYGFSAPIWIDNREAVTRLIPTTAQLISLIVSEPDKKLRVVVEKKEAA